MTHLNSIRKNMYFLLSVLLFATGLFLNPLSAKASGTTVYNGVDYSSVYDFDYYISHYPDIAQFFSNDPQGALEHFVIFGISEGRIGREAACDATPAATDSDPAAVSGPLSGMTVIIDAGHGGRDPGCIRNGVYEKNVNLSIVLKTAAMLRAQGATVLLTREGDSFVSLDYRYCFENLHPEAVFISIHCNALSGNNSFSGMNAYCNTASCAGSFDLAACVYSGVLFATGAKDRGIRTDSNLRVNLYSAIPSVLLETGYLSSRTEFPLLTSSDYQDLIAEGIVNGLTTYRSLHP